MDTGTVTEESHRRQDQQISVGTKRPISFVAGHDVSTDSPRRAVSACTRCRGHKVRCTGGFPCDRCVKSKSVCHREPTAQSIPVSRRRLGTSTDDATPSRRREPSGLNMNSPTTSQVVNGLARTSTNLTNDTLSHHGTFDSSSTLPRSPITSPQTRVDRLSDSHYAMHHATSNGELDAVMETASNVPPGNFSSSSTTKADDPEKRLAMAMEGSSEAPFRPLVYQPAAWRNREESRINTPDRELPIDRSVPVDAISWWSEKSLERSRKDPVSSGLLTIDACRTLYEFYVQHCHVFLPIIDIAQAEAFESIRKVPTLISSVIAVAARFYQGFTSRIASHGTSNDDFAVDPTLSLALAKLAEEQLADTFLRKLHTLADMQAILLLAAWGLHSGGEGPDAWVLSGHATRIGTRLGLHRLEAKTFDIESASDGDEQRKTARLESVMRQWRTWLCGSWFDEFISLGFGRPGTAHPGNSNDQIFLRNRLAQHGSPGAPSNIQGDMLIVSQIRLACIGREADRRATLVFSRSRTASVDQHILTSGSGSLNLLAMLEALNTELDDWYKTWIWAGAPCAAFLGSSSNIARLQAEHVRLSINSRVLEETPSESATFSKYLGKAIDAAISIIQIHYDSSQTGLSLSFAPDYVTLCLSQAALSLIKVHKAPPAVRAAVNLEQTVVTHYLTMAIKILARSDLSTTGLSTHLSTTITAIARVAGISTPTISVTEGHDAAETQNQLDLQTILGADTRFGQPVQTHTSDSYRDMPGSQDELLALLGIFNEDQQEGSMNPSGQVVDFSWLLGDVWNP